MRKIPKGVFDHTSHVALWDWLSKNPEARKEDWPGWKDFEKPNPYREGVIDHGMYNITAGCFACEYTWELAEGKTRCPLQYEGDNCFTNYSTYQTDVCLGGLYLARNSLFNYGNKEKYLKEKTRLAELIRDLPVRAGVETM